jgi:Domain of unknown function (DUF4158)
MSLYEKTVYPRLTQPLTADELAIHFTPSEEEIEFTIKTARLPGSRLSLMVLLKLFQKLHRFPNADEVPASVVEHLRIQLRFGAAVQPYYSNTTTPSSEPANEMRYENTRASRRGPKRLVTWRRLRVTKRLS